jgi:hypothetical protein
MLSVTSREISDEKDRTADKINIVLKEGVQLLRELTLIFFFLQASQAFMILIK